METLDLKTNQNEKVKNAIDRLRDLDIGFQSKIVVLLTYKKIKPVGQIGWLADRASLPEEERKQRNKDDIEKMENILNDLGLIWILNQGEWNGYDQFHFDFSLEKEVLDQFIEVHDDATLSTVERQRKYGEFFGFPPTAIDAWSAGHEFLLKNFDEIHHDAIDPEIKRFVEHLQLFRLSKAHWKEELEYYKKYAEVIKQIDPKLWEMIQSEKPGRPVIS